MENNQTILDAFKENIEKIEASYISEPMIEEFGYTQNVDEWINSIKKVHGDWTFPGDLNFDYEIIKGAEAYFTFPAICYKGEVITAETTTSRSLDEIKDMLRGKKYLLYMVLTQIKEGDFVNFEFVRLKEPEQKYCFRGYILENK